MKKVTNRFLGGVLALTITCTSVTLLIKDDNVAYATTYPAESKALRDAMAKVNHLTKSLKTNYLGIKNQAMWQTYIKESRDLIKKISSYEKTQRDALTIEVNKDEALVNGLARVNQVEKSITPKSEGGYGNALIIKNAETWNGYLKLAKVDLEKVDKSIFKKQYDELIDRLDKVSVVVKGIEDKFQVEYNKAVKLYEEAKNTKDLIKAKEALVEAEKLGTCDRSNKLEEEIKGFINGDMFEIISVDNIKETLNKGSKYNLPSKVKATFKSGDTGEVQVKWNASRVNTDSLGTQTFEGTIQNYNKKVSATINVIIYDIVASIRNYKIVG